MVDQHCAMCEDRDHAYTGVIIVLKKTAVTDIPISPFQINYANIYTV
jgi:hypothetical protein